MRLFIAIELPDDVRAALLREQSRMRALCASNRDIRWTAPQSLHLTLRFLGETPIGQVPAVIAALEALAGFAQFEVEVRGFGFFPDARHPRVFWAGIDAPPALAELAGRVDGALSNLGFPQENRAFTPHLTLARFRSPRADHALIKSVEESPPALGRFKVSEYFLFESRLLPGGAEHKKVARFGSS